MEKTIHSNKSISALLGPFVKSLAQVKQEYERVMMKIAGSLPPMEEEINDNILEARELLNFICSHNSAENNYGIIHEFGRFSEQLNEALEIFNEVDNLDKALFNEFKKSMEVSSATIHKMSEILSISENLKVFAINSIVHSQKVGNNGKGYQIISGEFIKLSGKIADRTVNISSLGKQLEKLIQQDLYESISSHETSSEKNISILSSDSQKRINNAIDTVHRFYGIFQGILGRIEEVNEPISRIMMEIQKQDIIHQQLDHLLSSIEDILVIVNSHPEDLDSLDNSQEHVSILTLLHVMVVNTEKQMKRINVELIDMLEHLEKLFAEMNQIIGAVKEEKDRQVNSSLVASKSHGSSMIENIFHAPKEQIAKLKDNLNYVVGHKKDIIQIYTEIVHKIREERDNAASFIPVIEAIKNLLLMARIEQARYALDISGLNGENSIGFSGESIVTLLDAVSEIERTYKLVSSDLAHSREQFEIQEGKYRQIEEDLQNSAGFLDTSRSLFEDNYLLIIELVDELFRELGKYLGLFDPLRLLNQDMLEKTNICTHIRELVDEKLEQIGGEVDLENCLFRDVILQKIVQKWTVMQERETLKEEFAGLEIEESSGSNITLF